MTAVPKLLTETEAANMIGIRPRTLRALRSQGKIRYIRPTPRKVFYCADDIAEYLEKHRRQDEPACPSINQPKAVSGTMISNSKVSAITEALAARQSAMRSDTSPKSDGKPR